MSQNVSGAYSLLLERKKWLSELSYPDNASSVLHFNPPDYLSAELWEYNPALSIWTEVLVSGASAPAARDGHTASVVGSKMIIFGGRGNDSGSAVLLGDEWEIDLDLKQDVTASTNSSTVTTAGVGKFL